jgi:hypothetical protein
MRESTDNCTSEPGVIVEATSKPERKKKDRDTHLDASNPKGTMLFFFFFFFFFHNYSSEDKYRRLLPLSLDECRCGQRIERRGIQNNNNNNAEIRSRTADYLQQQQAAANPRTREKAEDRHYYY